MRGSTADPLATDPEVRPGEAVNGYRTTLRR